ncbi:MAG: 50S ribosomal protein L29 [Coxiella sp. RIFCSPHIGHO2_12_FULL_42_15]|nr:MAG: 50S ribosomal protein L29 [Coxiella sp. RIFCSPHIGHO2_12_FULL_42_15]
MNTKDLRAKSVEELKREMIELRKEQLSLRMQKNAGEAAPKPHLHRRVRGDIARLKTILNEKEKQA